MPRVFIPILPLPISQYQAVSLPILLNLSPESLSFQHPQFPFFHIFLHVNVLYWINTTIHLYALSSDLPRATSINQKLVSICVPKFYLTHFSIVTIQLRLYYTMHIIIHLDSKPMEGTVWFSNSQMNFFFHLEARQKQTFFFVFAE